METKYYCVGFQWNGANPSSQLDRFLKDKIWENGYEDKFIETVSNVPVGARLAAKTAYTRKENGKTISVLEVHALGTVTGNPQDGQVLQVNWDQNFEKFTLDGGGAYRSTISRVHSEGNIQLIFNPDTRPRDFSTPLSLKFDVEDLSDDFPCNVILFGPPGTGKTYKTINKAVAVAEGIKEDKLSKWFPLRNELKDRFDELLIDEWENTSGQIAYVTFHQSMNYEEFIEGIKPGLNDNDEVIYDVVPGIFKRIADLALGNWLSAKKGSRKQLSFEEALNLLRDEWEEDNSLSFRMKRVGKEFKLTRWTNKSIEFEKSNNSRKHTLSKNTLREYYYNPGKIRSTGVGIYYPGVLEKLHSYSAQTFDEQEKSVKNYVLVIDEINRGNVSQIFGELITLIEDDKRYERPEGMAVILPYSQDKFIVPPNLFLIGTMNTADRSVEALDTALRRRFSFEEMLPEPELLRPSRLLWKFWWENYDFNWRDHVFVELEKKFYDLIGFPEDMNTETQKEMYWSPIYKEGAPKEEQIGKLNDLADKFTGIDLSLLLSAINRRLEKLLGKDYMIGHAYLIRVRSPEDLKDVFFSKILPLLQEYFYGDVARIGLVIGSSFLEVIKDHEIKFFEVEGLEADDLRDKYVYHIKKAIDFPDNVAFLKAIKAIYAI